METIEGTLEASMDQSRKRKDGIEATIPTVSGFS